MRIKRYLSDRPWLLVVAAFILLIAAWSTLIVIARRHAPAEVPLVRQSDSGKNS
jgi:hypothetical protein